MVIDNFGAQRLHGAAMKIAALVFLVSTGVCWSDLLDNSAQLKQRYGKPVAITQKENGTEFILFRWRPFIVLVGLQDGRSSHEAFKRIDGQPMTDTEIEKCVPFAKWRKIAETTWEIPPRAAVASYSKLNHELTIYSRGWWKQYGISSLVTIENWLATVGKGN